MKKILVFSILLAGSFLFRPCLSQADTTFWAYASTGSYSSLPPKIKVTATLTYTDTSTGKTNTITYKPVLKSFTVERDNNTSNIETFVIIADTIVPPATQQLLRFAASASGSGMQTGSKTDVTCVMDNALEPKFDFFDKMLIKGLLHDYVIDEPSMISIAATGSFTESAVTPKTGPPAINVISASIKYVIMGTVKVNSSDTQTYPAKIVLQVTASNIQAVI